MFKKIVFILLISLILFLVDQFFLGLRLNLSIFVIAVILFSLFNIKLRWPIIIVGGFILDLMYGTFFVNLLSLISVLLVMDIFSRRITIVNFVARTFLVIGGVILSLIFNLIFSWFLKLFVSSTFDPILHMSSVGIFSYIFLNVLVIWVLFLIFRKQLIQRGYEVF